MRIILIFKTWILNRYSFNYLLDAIFNRQLKYRKGKCLKNCGLCCRYARDLSYCRYLNKNTKKCKVYYKRKCNVSMPVNQEELDHFNKIFPDFKCGYYFENKKGKKI